MIRYMDDGGNNNSDFDMIMMINDDHEHYV